MLMLRMFLVLFIIIMLFFLLIMMLFLIHMPCLHHPTLRMLMVGIDLGAMFIMLLLMRLGVHHMHYRNPRLCRVSDSLPRAALGKVRLSVTSWFTECRTLGTGPHSTKTCLPSVKHSAKKELGKGPSAAVSLCREPRTRTRQRGFFAECQVLGTRQRTLYRVSSIDTLQTIFLFFIFWTPNFLWYVPTLCRPTCTILGQL
jgi:hypothetical protein